MKKYAILWLLALGTAGLTAQEPVDLLVSDSSWTKEVFQFPLSFAPDIPLEGIEEARFPKGWSDTSSVAHWSYVFAWQIQLQTALTTRELEAYLQQYFNGLMGWQNTQVSLTETAATGNTVEFTGKIETFDAFFTHKPMTLNVMITSQYCGPVKKSTVFFRFSPKGFEHDIWGRLNGVTMLSAGCAP